MPSQIIIALDYADLNKAQALIEQLNPERHALKVGKEMFTRFGPDFIKQLTEQKFKVFLDLKFHDIPNTVAKACRAAAELGVWMLTLHASGGETMLRAAKTAIADCKNKPLLIAVTVLTSLTQEDLSTIGVQGSVAEHSERLAQLTQAAGCDGVVCAATEAARLRQLCGEDFKLVTPGIRLADQDTQDQRRVMTPEKAQAAGSDYLVIGRAVTSADDPAAVLKSIEQHLK